MRHLRQALGEVGYACDKPIDRLSIVKEILRRLGERGWPHKTDIGWSDYDVEIYDTRWCKVQVTTVVEERGNFLLRCRLRARWSLRAKVVFWGLLGAELLGLALLYPRQPWPWLLLLTVPAAALFLRLQERNLQSIVGVFLNEMAKESGLEKAPVETF